MRDLQKTSIIPLFFFSCLFFFSSQIYSQTYCSFTPSSVQTVHITNVTIGSGGGINKTDGAGAGAIRDYTGDTDGTVETSGSYTSSVTCQQTIFGQGWLIVGVDWNDDGDWLDTDEVIVSDETINVGAGTQVFNFTLNVPSGASIATVRMRVYARRGTAGALCTGYSGEAEDYELVVSAPGPNVKDNNTTNLNVAGSWTTSVPTSGEDAKWESTVTGANTVSLGADLEFQSVTIEDPGGLVTINSGNTLTLGTGGVDMSAATQDFTMNNAVTLGSAQSWNVTTGRQLTASGNVGGAVKLTKSGAGTLELSGTNSFTGGVDLDAGSLEIGSSNALGTVAGTLSIASGTTIDNTSGGVLTTLNYPVDINGDFTFTGTNSIDFGTGNISLSANAVISVENSTITFGGVLSGSSNITKEGPGHVYFTNESNTYTGKTSIIQTSSSAGALFFETIKNVGGGASSLGAPTTIGNGTIAIGSGIYGGKLIFDGTADQTTDRVIDLASTTGEVQLSSGSSGSNLTFTSDLTATGAGDKTLALRGSSATNEIQGVIVDNSGSNLTSLDKREAGVWILSGDNTYTGTTTITDGTLQIGNGGTSGSIASTSVVNGGNLEINRSDALTYSGVISSSGSVEKKGAGTLTLSGANSYTGDTKLTAGIVQLGAANVLSNSSTVDFNGGNFSTGSGAGYSETVGTMDLTENSTLVLGTGNHTLSFAASNGESFTASKTLTIEGWDGPYDGTAELGSDPKIFVGSASTHLSAGQLEQIGFSKDGYTYSASLLATGELVANITLLPVDLRYFEVSELGDYAMVSWETLSEVENDYFIIEKSMDGQNWEELKEIPGAGNSLEPIAYSFVDIEGCSGSCLYRLKQVDYDGTSKIYRAVVLGDNAIEKELGIKVSPNPAVGDVVVSFNSPTEGLFDFTVNSQDGKLVYQASVMGVEGVNYFTHDCSDLKSGVYLFVIRDEYGNISHERVMK